MQLQFQSLSSHPFSVLSDLADEACSSVPNRYQNSYQLFVVNGGR